MRFIIYGAGGIGGAIGGRLFLAGNDVLLIARGRHHAVLREQGLRLRTPEGDHQLPIPVVGHPDEIDFRPGDAVFLTMKTQDTEGALRDLELAAPADIPVICAQNGVENERLAARRFANVYAMLVGLPATFLEPGEVIASGSPLSGALHAGRYPSGRDETIDAVCAALRGANYLADVDPQPMKLKYRKLQLNLGNALEVLTGGIAWSATGELGAFAEKLRTESAAVFEAAGIEWTGAEEYQERVAKHYRPVPIGGEPRGASSTMQSIIRGHNTIEVDFLNGEIVLLGQLHGVPTPYNGLVRRLATEVAAGKRGPGTLTVADLDRMAEAEAAGSAVLHD